MFEDGPDDYGPRSRGRGGRRDGMAGAGTLSQENDPLLRNVPPNSQEAERAVLGAIMIDGRAIDDVAQTVSPEDFYFQAHVQIYETVLELHRQNKPVDVVLLNEELERRGALEAVGGTAALAELCEVVPSAANAEYYAKIVRDRAVQRKLIEVTAQVQRDAFATGGPVDELLDRAEQSMFEVTQRRIRSEAVAIGEVVQEAYDQLVAREQGHSVSGLPSYFADLDEVTGGFMPGEMTIIAARPSMGKCLAFDAEVVLEDGEVATMEELYRRRAARLLTLGDDWRLRWTSPSVYVDDGEKPVFRVTTRLGRSIETTLTHPFRRLDGWRPLAELRVGDRIAVPRRLDVFGRERLRDCEVILLGYLLGDGGLTARCPHFTSGIPALQRDFLAAVEAFGGLTARRTETASHRTPSWRVSADKEAVRGERRAFAERLSAAVHAASLTGKALAERCGVTPGAVHGWLHGAAVPGDEAFAAACAALGVEAEVLAPGGLARLQARRRNGLTQWLQELGLMGHGAATKTIPPQVFRLEKEQVRLFLSRLLATDGWVSVLASGQVQAGYASVSERLARQVQHLLLRFGVLAALKRREVRYGDGTREAWQLDVTDRRSLEVLLDEVGVFGKEQAVARAQAALARRPRRTNRDLVPVEVWGSLEAAKGDESWSSLARRAGLAGASNVHVGRRALTRGRLALLAEAVGDPELAALAQSDVYWDEIVAIEPVGTKQVYDLTIPGTHNFVANDVCVHNTSFTLNLLRNMVHNGAAACFFSLEMPRLQVTSNLLCGIARLDGHRLRGGFLTKEEKRSFMQACETLQHAQLFIDDNPALSTMELRAKGRRLRSQHNIDVIAIDYLQLMTGSSRAARESRQIEVSEISRQVKALARELEIPILCLAQLSRKVEDRKDKKPMMSDLRESGCLTGDTLVTLADDGRRVPIRELEGRSGFGVWALDPETYTLRRAVVSRAFATGVKPTFRLETQLGRAVGATANHKFLTLEGWRRLDELKEGDRIALPRTIPAPESVEAPMSHAELALLGHLIGDGCTLPRRSIQDTTRAAHVASAVGSEALATLARSDVYWDRITRIAPAVEEQVYDLTVPGPHNFVAGGVIVHNSIEQDADKIVLLHRPEYYEPDKEELKGKANVIVAKNRNGPTGEVEMHFHKSQMRFETLTRM